MRKVVYVAGPYTNPAMDGVWTNVQNARHIAKKVWEAGGAAICPHLNTLFMDSPQLTHDVFMDGDLSILYACDALVLLGGWESSKGAIEERAFAERNKIPIFTEDDVLFGDDAFLHFLRDFPEDYGN